MDSASTTCAGRATGGCSSPDRTAPWPSCRRELRRSHPAASTRRRDMSRSCTPVAGRALCRDGRLEVGREYWAGPSAATASRVIRFPRANSRDHEQTIRGCLAVALVCASASAVVQSGRAGPRILADGAGPAANKADGRPTAVPWATSAIHRWPRSTAQRRAPEVCGARLRGSGLGPSIRRSAAVVLRRVIYIVTGADDVFAVGVETGTSSGVRAT